MKINELSIGNTISYNDILYDIFAIYMKNGQYKVDLIKSFSSKIDLFEIDIDKINPIKLTKELIDNFDWDYQKTSFFYISNFNTDEYYLSNDDLPVALKKIKYFHQLQNLYKILIEEE